MLAALFWMLTLLAYAWYARRPSAGRYAALFLSIAMGLLAKPMLVTLPFVLLLLDVWPLRRIEFDPSLASSRQHLKLAVLEKIPLLALVLASSVLTFIAQHSGGAVVAVQNLPIEQRIYNAILAYVRYIGKLIWPSNLAVFYPRPREIPIWQVAAAAGVLVILSIVAIRCIRRRPYVTVGWFWYLGTLVPVIGVVQVGEQAIADRYTYVPLVGLTIIVAWGVADLFASILERPRLRDRSPGQAFREDWERRRSE